MKKLLTLVLAVVSYLATTAYASETQVNCLAKAMYFEARGGKPHEQINVGNTILNRTKHEAFPSTVCKVVADRKHAIQFPWYYNGASVRDNSTFKSIKERARELYTQYVSGTRTDTVKGALFFHAKTINPRWRYKSIHVNDALHKYYTTYS